MDHMIRGVQEHNYTDLSLENMYKFLHDHKIYLSRQEI